MNNVNQPNTTFLVFSIHWKYIKNIRNTSVGAVQHACSQKQDFYNTSICTNKESHRHWYTHTKTDWQDSRTAHTTHVTAETLSGGDSEFSVNMHALWLKHLNFPLVPYHTVLHSACSSNRLIGPIIFHKFRFDKRPQTISTSLIVGWIKWFPPSTFHALTHFMTCEGEQGHKP